MAPEPDATTAAHEDAELMRRVQKGDDAAFAQLMDRWEVPVKAVIGRIVMNTSEAEELAQETFVRLWEHRSRYAPDRPLKAWLLGIAINLARNRLRWWKRRPQISLDAWTETTPGPSASAGGAASLEDRERANAVRDAIHALPPDFREALVLFEYERMSYAEVAATLGITPKTAENRILRAREKLRRRLRTWL